MLRAFIIGWLIISTFGYGSVMAFDIHADAAEQHEQSASPAKHSDEGDDHPACDHCCHTASHLLGLWSSQPLIDVQRVAQSVSSYGAAYSFLSLDPPDHPPRS